MSEEDTEYRELVKLIFATTVASQYRSQGATLAEMVRFAEQAAETLLRERRGRR